MASEQLQKWDFAVQSQVGCFSDCCIALLAATAAICCFTMSGECLEREPHLDDDACESITCSVYVKKTITLAGVVESLMK